MHAVELFCKLEVDHETVKKVEGKKADMPLKS